MDLPLFINRHCFMKTFLYLIIFFFHFTLCYCQNSVKSVKRCSIYSYELNGNQAKNKQIHQIIYYDVNGNKIKDKLFYLGKLSEEKRYVYDKENKVVKSENILLNAMKNTTSSDKLSVSKEITTYQYNKKKDTLEVIRKNDDGFIRTKYSYNKRGLKIKKEKYFPRTSDNVITKTYIIFKYDMSGNIIKEIFYNQDGSKLYVKKYNKFHKIYEEEFFDREESSYYTHYRYDGKGNLIKWKIYNKNKILKDEGKVIYDTLNQGVKITYQNSNNKIIKSWKYDKNKNLLRKIDKSIISDLEKRISYRYNKRGQKNFEDFSGITQYKYIYDSKGLLKEKVESERNKPYKLYRYYYDFY